MPTLLDLPSELLAAIIDYIYHFPYPLDTTTATEDIPNGKNCTTSPSRCRPRQAASCRNTICPPTRPLLYPSTTTHLLLTCRKLHAQVIAYLRTAQAQHQPLRLDIAIIDNHWIWPLWQHIPFSHPIGPVVPALEINLTECSLENDSNSPTTGWDWELTDPYGRVTVCRRMTQESLLRMIAQLLRQGPASLSASGAATLRTTDVEARKQQHPQGYFRIQELTFCIDDANMDEPSSYRPPPHNLAIPESLVPFRTIEGFAHLDYSVLYPESHAYALSQLSALADFMATSIHENPFGLMIRERVDRIIFRTGRGKRGEVRRVIEIAEDLRRKSEQRVSEYKRRMSESVVDEGTI